MTAVLMKNAKLWQWDHNVISKIGYAHDCPWLVIENGVITDICSALDLRSHPPEEKFFKIIDIDHQLVVPGLNDAHM